ncbi:MAG: hypothetical protein DRQ55_17690 [Planctomycetota bacterium]|nr:MAG: hypothetical protein DRQ55_17690 [Planctomycetota bacterium]
MTGPTQTFKVRFGNEPLTRPQQPEPAAEPGPEPVIPEGYASRAARYLAMAHKMDALLRDGRLRHYEHAAAWLGVSKTRANIISRMIFLAPDIQEAILLGDTAASEHALRAIAREPVWEEQRRLWRW